MLQAEQIDTLTEIVVQHLLIEGQSAHGLARIIAVRVHDLGRDLPALCVALPFTLAAGAIDEMLGGGAQARAAAREAWRTAALIGADIVAIEIETGCAVSVARLLARWSEGDELFAATPLTPETQRGPGPAG